MSAPILATKLYIPPPRPRVVLRPRLIERLNEGLHRQLTLISAPAGFGKTTLLSEWVAKSERAEPGVRCAWLSLDPSDNDPTRFLTYLVAALQTIAGNIGAGVMSALQSPQPPPVEAILTALLNEITAIPDDFVLILDDFHTVEAKPVENALAFLLEHLPPRMHLVVATREDPQIPLARLRSRDQLTELRATDLRFTSSEATGFLNQVMALNLSAEEIAALETRTEGWVAGLQLAALALQGASSTQGQPDTAGFLRSFTGSHRFVLDYLIEEVLQKQPEPVQRFLLRTSILDRLCGPLCDAVCADETGLNSPGQQTLEYLERANLFIVPLDNERRWYRYHHLFADLLRQRVQQSAAFSTGDVAEFHRRASRWFEANGLEIEAFQHAAAAGDLENAARLLEGGGMPLLFRGAVVPVLSWLESLPPAVLDARPSLWVIYASAMLFISNLAGVEPKLRAAEAALQGRELDERNRDLVGHIASIRATAAVTQHQAETILEQSRRALAFLHPDNLPVRTATIWTLGYAHQFQGNRAAARQAYTEAQSISQSIGHYIILIMSTIGLGNIEEMDNQLPQAAEIYRRVLQLVGDPPLPIACEAHLGLARIGYQWNDLDAAQEHAEQSARLARQIENTDRFIASDLFLARLKLAQGDIAGASAMLAQAGQTAQQHNFWAQLPEIAAAQVLVFLRQGNLEAAARLAQAHDLPTSQARVYLARGEPSAALAVLEAFRRQMEDKGWADQRLQGLVLQTIALRAHGETERALQVLEDALALAEPGGLIRLFVDEGPPMAELLSAVAAQGKMPDYTGRLLAAFHTEGQGHPSKAELATRAVHQAAQKESSPLVDPLSPRELEILRLIAQGLSNEEIGARLFLALSTVKGHTQRIFDKLQVRRRTEAVARARELGLL